MSAQLKAWDIVVDRISAEEDPFFKKVIDVPEGLRREGDELPELLNQPDYKFGLQALLRLSEPNRFFAGRSRKNSVDAARDSRFGCSRLAS